MNRAYLLAVLGGALVVAAVLARLLLWPGSAPREIVVLNGTINAPPLPARRTVPNDEVVPEAELLAHLQSYVDYLTTQKRIRMRRNTGGTDTEFGLQLNGGSNDALAKRLQGLGDHEAQGILSSLPDRVQINLDDFYDANIGPLVVSLRNIRLYRTPVARDDLKRLDQEFERLKIYEAALRSDLATEWQIEAGALNVFLELRDTVIKVRSLAQSWSARADGACAPTVGAGASCDALRAAFLAAKQPILDRRAALRRRLETLQGEDDALAEHYSRQYFMFEIPSIYAVGSKATPLVDGHVVFGRVAELLDSVTKNAGGKGYVHMSFWSCSLDTPLTDEKGATFAKAIQRVAAAGNEVSLLLWEGNSWVFPGVVAGNAECKRVLEKLGPNVHVTIAHHSATGAYHQKEMIFYDGSRVSAIVGGLNMDGSEYASSPHAQSQLGGYRDVHDVAVELEGSVTRDLEWEFLRRWYHDAPIALRGISQPSPVQPNSDIAVLTTSPPASSDEANAHDFPSIKEALIDRLSKAEHLVYLENYSIHEEDVTKALAERIRVRKAVGKPLAVVIVIYDDKDLDNWLAGITYRVLSFMACDSFTYKDASGQSRTVDRAHSGGKVWRVGPYNKVQHTGPSNLVPVDTKGFMKGFYEDTMVYWDDGEAKLTDIVQFNPDTPLFAPVVVNKSGLQPVWVHAKVAIVDDEYAFVGSANFNPRSMGSDGELDVLIHGAPAKELREMLWREYNNGALPNGPEWRRVAEVNASMVPRLQDNRFSYGVPSANAKPVLNLARDQIHLVALHIQDLGRDAPDALLDQAGRQAGSDPGKAGVVAFHRQFDSAANH